MHMVVSNYAYQLNPKVLYNYTVMYTISIYFVMIFKELYLENNNKQNMITMTSRPSLNIHKPLVYSSLIPHFPLKAWGALRARKEG